MKYKRLGHFILLSGLIFLMIFMNTLEKVEVSRQYEKTHVLRYDQAPWNTTDSFYAYKNEDISLTIEFMGSVVITGEVQGLWDARQDILVNHTLTGEKALVENEVLHVIKRHYRLETAVNMTFHISIHQLLINESNIDELMLYMKQVKVFIKLEASLELDPLLRSSLLFFVLLEITSALGLYLFKREKKRDVVLRDVDLDELKFTKASHKKNQGEWLGLEYLFEFLPHPIFLSILSLVLLFPVMQVYTAPISVPLSRFAQSQSLFFMIEKHVTIAFIFVEISLGVFGLQYLSKQYEHFWTYPFSRKRFFIQILLLMLTFYGVWIFYYLLYVVFIRGYFLFGIPVFSLVNAMFIVEILSHGLIMMGDVLLIVILHLKIKSQTGSMIVSGGLLLSINFMLPSSIVVISHRSLFQMEFAGEALNMGALFFFLLIFVGLASYALYITLKKVELV